MFTQDEINFINQLIDARIAHHAQLDHQNSRMRDFHTIGDIKALILKNVEEFRSFCSGDEFHLATLTMFLKMHTELTAYDKETLSQGKNKVTRFESQVRSVFSKWRNAPIKRAARRGYYRFVNLRQTQP
jgi:uncharacterized Rmd1/YagE family protein